MDAVGTIYIGMVEESSPVREVWRQNAGANINALHARCDHFHFPTNYDSEWTL